MQIKDVKGRDIKMSEADYQVERQLNKALKVGSFRPATTIVNTRAILERVATNEIQRVALEMYNDGFRTDEKYEKMNVELMNSPYNLSLKQKNALITFIMYAG